MGKLLSWIVVIALVYAGMRLFVLFQRKSQAAALARERRAQAEAAGRSTSAHPRGGKTPAEGEKMLACAHCGAWWGGAGGGGGPSQPDRRHRW